MTDDNLSIVQSPRDYFDIVNLEDPRFLETFLDEPLTVITETITGALAVGGKGVMVSGGKLVQALFRGRIYKQFAEELRAFRDAGKIADDFADTRYGFQTWVELMSIIDEESPDEDRLEALKAMFYAVNKVKADDGARIQAYQLWQTTKELKSADLILLKGVYEIEDRAPSNIDWAGFMAERTGLGIAELVQLHEKRLSDLRLILSRFDPQSKMQMRPTGSITTFGRRVCEHIQTYQIDLEAAKKKNAK